MATRQEAQFHEDSYRPRIAGKSTSSLAQQMKTKLNLQQSQLLQQRGGRNFQSVRPAFLKTSIVTSASGSAYIEFGQTKVLCSIFGPKPKQQGRSEFNNRGAVVCDLRHAPFSAHTKERNGHRQTADEKYLSEVVRRAVSASIQLDKFPKSVLEVNLLILENDGGALSAAINCASAALVDSGIELFDMVKSCSVALLDTDSGSVIVVDPTAKEEEQATAVAHLAMANSDMVTEFECHGQLNFEESGKVVAAGTQACQALHTVLSEQLIQLTQDKLA